MGDHISDKGKKLYWIYAIVVFSSILWGLTFLGSKIALEELNAEEVLAARWTLAAILFIAMAVFGVIKVSYKGKPFYKIFLVSLAQPCVSALCETIGVDITSPSVSAIFYAMIPIVVTVLSLIIFKEKLLPLELIGVIIATVGIVTSLISRNGEGLSGSVKGLIVLSIMVLASALFALFSKWALTDFKPMEIAYIQAVMAAIWFNGLALIKTGKLEWVTKTAYNHNTLIAVLFLGIIGSCLCYIIYQMALNYIPIVQASTIQINFISITGVVSGIVINHDPWQINTVIGITLVLVGIYLCNKEKLNKGKVK